MDSLAPQREQWAVPERRFIMGVDLGQSFDPTAIAILEHRVEPTGEWEFVPGGTKARREIARTRFNVRHLERRPLRTAYPEIVSYVGALLERPPLAANGALVLDQTGVGAPVADLFEHAGLWPVRISITSGSEPNGRGQRWSVPKHALISTLDAKLATGELRFAADLGEGQALASELGDFRRKVSDAGRASYAARVGKHDDLVLAVAIALWWACKPVPDVGMVRLRGVY